MIGSDYSSWATRYFDQICLFLQWLKSGWFSSPTSSMTMIMWKWSGVPAWKPRQSWTFPLFHNSGLYLTRSIIIISRSIIIISNKTRHYSDTLIIHCKRKISSGEALPLRHLGHPAPSWPCQLPYWHHKVWWSSAQKIVNFFWPCQLLYWHHKVWSSSDRHS